MNSIVNTNCFKVIHVLIKSSLLYCEFICNLHFLVKIKKKNNNNTMWKTKNEFEVNTDFISTRIHCTRSFEALEKITSHTK